MNIIRRYSSRELSGIVYSLYSLLLMEVKDALQRSETFQNSYNLVSNPHPFMRLLMKNRDSWNKIFVYIKQFYKDKDERYDLHSFRNL